jgi:protein tyrosine kinase modulator
MTSPISPDAPGLASREPVPPVRREPATDRAGDGVLTRIARRWWLIAAAVFLAAVGGFVYLMMTPAVYTATAVLAPDGRLGEVGSRNIPPDEFLRAQRELLLSTNVLGSAVASLDASARSGAAASPQALRNALDVKTSVGEQTIVAQLDSPDPQAAARVLSAVADAYLRAQGEQRTSTVAGLAELRTQRDARAAARAAAQKALDDFKAQANVSGTDADKAGASRLEQLRAALTAAQLDATNATAAFDAANDLLADPQKAAQTIEANRSKGIFAGLDQQRGQLQSQLDQLNALADRQKQSMSPQHPRVLETQRNIVATKAKLQELGAKYADVYRAYLDEQRLTAQRKVAEVKGLIEEQSKQSGDYATKVAKVAELEAALKKADTALAETDQKLRDIAAGSGAAAAEPPAVRIVQSPQVPKAPSRPDRVRVLCAALVIGLVAGIALAAAVPGRSRR